MQKGRFPNDIVRRVMVLSFDLIWKKCSALCTFGLSLVGKFHYSYERAKYFQHSTSFLMRDKISIYGKTFSAFHSLSRVMKKI